MKKLVLTKQILKRFEKALKEDEKSPATIEKYLRDAKAFASFCGEKPLSKALVGEFKEKLKENGYSARSQNSITASLNSLFSCLGLYSFKTKTVKIQKTVFCPEEKELSKEEYYRLVKAAEKDGNERLSLILQTICGTGIRVSELRFITVSAVTRGEAEVFNKGRARKIFIIKELKAKLLSYIRKQGIKQGEVFVTRSGKPVCRVNVWREMKALCQRAGVLPEKVFPHNLRHLFSRVFYAIYKDISKLADILGHGSVETTRIYMQSSGAEHRRCMEKMRLIL